MATKKTESSAKQANAGAKSLKTTITTPETKPEAKVEVEVTVKSANKTAMLEVPAAKKETKAIKESKKHVTLDHIAARAYLLWLERGCQHGDDVNDWLRAEAELSERN